MRSAATIEEKIARRKEYFVRPRTFCATRGNFVFDGKNVPTFGPRYTIKGAAWLADDRSEEHTSELQSRFGISYAVCCLEKITPSTRRLGRGPTVRAPKVQADWWPA